MVPDQRVVARRDLEEVLAGVQVDRGEGAVGRLVDGQPVRQVQRAAVAVEPVAALGLVGVGLGDREERRELVGLDVDHPGLGVGGRAAPVRAAEDPGVRDRPAERRRGVEPSHPVLADDLERLLPHLGGEGDHVVLGEALLREGRGLGGEGLGLGGPFAGDVTGGDRAVLDGPDRLAGHPVEDVDETGLRRGRDGVDLPAVHVDGQQRRGGGQVVVPEAVLHGLEVPDPLAGAGVEADDGLREEVVAEAVSAVVVVARRPDRADRRVRVRRRGTSAPRRSCGPPGPRRRPPRCRSRTRPAAGSG